MGKRISPSDEPPVWLEHGREIYALIKPYAVCKTGQEGHIFIHQGEAVSKIYLVLRGRAQAFMYTEDGQRFWLADFLPGDLFGHPEILSNVPIEFEIRADTDMQFAVLAAGTFDDLLHSTPHLGKNVSVDLAGSLGRAQSRLYELATLSAKGRICAELYRMAKPIGKTPDIRIIRPSPVFSSFAMRVHSTRETVSRTINRLQKQGIVAREAGALVILKPERLQQVS